MPSPTILIPPTADMLTTGQAGRLIGLSREHVRRLIAAGTIPATPTPLGNLIQRVHVDAEIARRAGTVARDDG